MNLIKHLPNALTCGNVICGFIGILFIFEGQLLMATYMVWAGAFFDVLDGMVARLLKVASPIGKELDSLADMVTFGALPAFYTFQLLETKSDGWGYIAIIIIVFSAVRLAKFNVDTRQENYFIGLPTPANTIFFTSLPFFLSSPTFQFLDNIYVLATLVVVFSLLLVAEIPLLSFKVKSFHWRSNQFLYLLLIVSVTLVVLLGFSALPLTIISYISISLIWNLIEKPFVIKKG